MTPGARVQAAVEILDQIEQGEPAEKALTNWSRRSRFAGSKDRRAVRDHVFGALRTLRSSQAIGGGTSGRATMIGYLLQDGQDVDALFSGARHAPDALSAAEKDKLSQTTDLEDGKRLDLPDWIITDFERSLGTDLADVAKTLTKRAPVFLRANPMQHNGESLAKTLTEKGYNAQTHALSPLAVEVLGEPTNLASTDLFASGAYDFQDAASQAVVDGIADLAGNTVLDFCAGGGGKSLALALAGKQVTASDISDQRMRDIPDRAARSGTRIDVRTMKSLTPKDEFDIVVCDVPCSGTGAWRRQPESKWRLNQDRLNSLTVTQQNILERAQSHVRSKGWLVYVTCSVLDLENQEQVQRFLRNYPEWSLYSQRAISVLEGGDGFYWAALTRSETSD